MPPFEIPIIQVDCACSHCGNIIASCSSGLCGACSAIASSHHAASAAASVNSHNHFAAVIDYSRLKFLSPLNPYQIMIYEIQNLFKTAQLLDDSAQSFRSTCPELEVGDSQSANHLASLVGFTPAYRCDPEKIVRSSEFVLSQFGMPKFSVSASVRHDEQHFVNILFNFKVFQRLCLAANLLSAKWMPKTHVCYIEVNENESQAASEISDQLRTIYEKASRFLSLSVPWVLKTHASRGEGNVFVNASTFENFRSAVTTFMQRKPGGWICLIEEVHNISKQKSAGTSKTYRSLVYYNSLTDEFNMQNIYCNLTEGSVDSHQAQRWRHYPEGVEASCQSSTELETSLDQGKIERNLNVAQHKSGLFHVFKKLCQHVTQPREIFWDPLIQTFLPIYVHRPLNDKLLFNDDDTVTMVQTLYRSLRFGSDFG